MGKYLDQCCDDAWDVICGRKKIVGNRVMKIEDVKEIENKSKENYGWLAPDGTFHPVKFGNHQAWATKYLSELYRKGEISYEQVGHKNVYADNFLIDMGWILIHNPHRYGFKITRNLSKIVTKKQKDYLRSIGKIGELDKEFLR